jgi:hypothetical protein
LLREYHPCPLKLPLAGSLPNAEPVLLQDGERVLELPTVLRDRRDRQGALLRRTEPVEPKQHDSVMHSILTEDQLAEILVGRDQDALVANCQLEDFVVPNSWLHLRHVRDVVTCSAKRVDDLPVDTLVTDELQADQVATG